MTGSGRPVAEQEAAGKSFTGRRLTVVLADDEPDIITLLRRMLDLDGRFEVVAEVGDGESAVAEVREKKPDAIVLDLAMPVLDGLSAIPKIIEASSDTKVVVLSAFASGEMSAKALTSGATVYMEKGDAVRDLVPTLISVCT